MHNDYKLSGSKKRHFAPKFGKFRTEKFIIFDKKFTKTVK